MKQSTDEVSLHDKHSIRGGLIKVERDLKVGMREKKPKSNKGKMNKIKKHRPARKKHSKRGGSKHAKSRKKKHTKPGKIKRSKPKKDKPEKDKGGPPQKEKPKKDKPKDKKPGKDKKDKDRKPGKDKKGKDKKPGKDKKKDKLPPSCDAKLACDDPVIYASSGNRGSEPGFGASLLNGLYIIDPSGTSTKIGDPSLPEAVIEIVIDPKSSRAWAQQGRPNFEFFEFDLKTAEEVPGTRFSTEAINQFHGLEFVGCDLYGAGWMQLGGSAFEGSALYKIKPDSQSWTLVGETGVRPITGLAWTGSVLYGTSGAGYPPSLLYSLDVKTGAGTVVCDNLEAGFGSLLYKDGVLYGGSSDGYIYEIDPDTCEVTQLWFTDFRPVTGLSLGCP